MTFMKWPSIGELVLSVVRSPCQFLVSWFWFFWLHLAFLLRSKTTQLSYLLLDFLFDVFDFLFGQSGMSFLGGNVWSKREGI